MAAFDNKIFNADVFQKYVNSVPDLKRDMLISSGVLRENKRLKMALKEGVGGNYITEPYKGLLGGDALNYDGNTDLTATSRDTYKQGKVVIGRMKMWSEKDFSYDITGGVDFKATAGEVAKYLKDLNQGLMIKILKGIFAMSDSASAAFVTNHTYDISEETTDNKADQTTLNKAMQKACGDNKSAFALAIVHSQVATNLENLNLLENLKYTDKNGIERDLGLYTWNGRLLLIDDDMPVTTATGGSVYTSYVLGKGAFEYCDIGAKVPYEYDRDTKLAGGTDYIACRERVLFAPAGISFKASGMAGNSPTDDELQSATSWELIKNAGGTGVFPHKAIPIAQIKSLG